jgi:hypothetical protein
MGIFNFVAESVGFGASTPHAGLCTLEASAMSVQLPVFVAAWSTGEERRQKAWCVTWQAISLNKD